MIASLQKSVLNTTSVTGEYQSVLFKSNEKRFFSWFQLPEMIRAQYNTYFCIQVLRTGIVIQMSHITDF